MINIEPSHNADLQTGASDVSVSEDISRTGNYEERQYSDVEGWAGSESDKSRAKMFTAFKSVGKVLGWILGTLLVLLGVLAVIYTWNQTRMYEDLIIPTTEDRKEFQDLKDRVSALEEEKNGTLIQILEELIKLQKVGDK